MREPLSPPCPDRAPRPDTGAARRRPSGAASFRRPLLLVVFALLLGGVSAQDAGSVTPDRLAALLPATWHGLPVSEHQAAIGRSGAANANAHYDDTSNGGSSRDLSLAITDLGPYRDATLLVYRADAAAGRVDATEIGGYPAFQSVDFGNPTLVLVAGRMGIRTRAFGDLFSADDLRQAVAALPLDAIAGLSDLPPAPDAHYRPLAFTPGALRHFLPEKVLGLARADGYYAKRHPAGTPWGGWVYEGTHLGHDVRLRVSVWDLGTLAASARTRLENDAQHWTAFEQDGHRGFMEKGTPTPKVLLFDGRFRLQIDAPGQLGVTAGWMRGGFAGVDLERLARFADLVPAPHPELDPLVGQPALIAPDALARALPASLDGRQRGEVKAEVASSRGHPFDVAYARASYRAEGRAPLSVMVSDEGVVPVRVKERRAGMPTLHLAGHAVAVSEDRHTAIATVGGRIVITVQSRAVDGSEPPSAEQLAKDLTGLDLERLLRLAQQGGSSS